MLKKTSWRRLKSETTCLTIAIFCTETCIVKLGTPTYELVDTTKPVVLQKCWHQIIIVDVIQTAELGDYSPEVHLPNYISEISCHPLLTDTKAQIVSDIHRTLMYVFFVFFCCDALFYVFFYHHDLTSDYCDHIVIAAIFNPLMPCLWCASSMFLLWSLTHWCHARGVCLSNFCCDF